MLRRHQLDSAWFVLLALAGTTLLACRLMSPGPLASAVLLGLAVLKGRRILLDFLGLRDAHALWRGIVTAWVCGVASFAWAASAARLLI